MPSWKRRILQNLPCSRGATSKLQLMVVSNYCYSIWGHWLNSCQGLNFIWGFFSPSAKITAQLWIIATLDFQSKGLMKFISLQIVKFGCLVTSAHMQYHSSDTHQKYLECLLKHHILKEAQLMTWERSKTKIDKCGNKKLIEKSVLCALWSSTNRYWLEKGKKTSEEITMLGRRQLVKKNV